MHECDHSQSTPNLTALIYFFQGKSEVRIGKDLVVIESISHQTSFTTPIREVGRLLRISSHLKRGLFSCQRVSRPSQSTPGRKYNFRIYLNGHCDSCHFQRAWMHMYVVKLRKVNDFCPQDLLYWKAVERHNPYLIWLCSIIEPTHSAHIWIVRQKKTVISNN